MRIHSSPFEFVPFGQFDAPPQPVRSKQRFNAARVAATEVFTDTRQIGGMVSAAGTHLVQRCNAPLDDPFEHMQAHHRRAYAVGQTAWTPAACVFSALVGLAALVNPLETYHKAATGASPQGMALCVETSTGRCYNADPPQVVRFKCLALCAGAPVLLSVSVGVTMATRLSSAVRAAYRCEFDQAARALGVAALAPLIGVALACTALTGVVTPLAARRRYANLENAMHFRTAPCFAPIPRRMRPNGEHHFFGGVRVGNSLW